MSGLGSNSENWRVRGEDSSTIPGSLDARGGSGDKMKTEDSDMEVGRRDATNAKYGAPTSNLDYFEELVHDRKQLLATAQNMQGPAAASFQHLSKLLEREIKRVHDDIATGNKEPGGEADAGHGGSVPMESTDGEEQVRLVEKIVVPNDKFPEYNFAGRILGPCGMTVKQLEQRTGCKIQVRGRGSAKKRLVPTGSGDGSTGNDEEQLHVIIVAHDTECRARASLDAAKSEIMKLLNPIGEDGMDSLKKKQLMELAIIRGTYRPPAHLQNKTEVATQMQKAGRSLAYGSAWSTNTRHRRNSFGRRSSEGIAPPGTYYAPPVTMGNQQMSWRAMPAGQPMYATPANLANPGSYYMAAAPGPQYGNTPYLVPCAPQYEAMAHGMASAGSSGIAAALTATATDVDALVQQAVLAQQRK